jgi:hypothetical protein
VPAYCRLKKRLFYFIGVILASPSFPKIWHLEYCCISSIIYLKLAQQRYHMLRTWKCVSFRRFYSVFKKKKTLT